MKLIHPLGRDVASEMDANYEAITPFACRCNGVPLDTIFANARGPNDNCTHCGCGCSFMTAGSASSWASTTNRAS